jgi:hypothetical protein
MSRFSIDYSQKAVRQAVCGPVRIEHLFVVSPAIAALGAM